MEKQHGARCPLDRTSTPDDHVVPVADRPNMRPASEIEEAPNVHPGDGSERDGAADQGYVRPVWKT